MARLVRERFHTGAVLGDIARREACDLVHTSSTTIVSGPPAARRAGIPHVWQLRKAPRERGLKARVLGTTLGRAKRVLAVKRDGGGSRRSVTACPWRPRIGGESGAVPRTAAEQAGRRLGERRPQAC